jgi:starch-binding outer membrane protein, SusD/RagB family
MKKKSLIVILALTFGLFSCDVLDVEPEQSISSEVVFESVENARGAVTGMYQAVRFSSGYGGFSMMASEFVTDNTDFQGSFTTWQEVAQYAIPTNNGTISGQWEDLYDGINRANNVLANVADVPDIPQELVDQWSGEAYFVRAILHFQLVRYFAQPYGFTADNSHPGVPYMTEPGEGAGDHNLVTRNTVAEVYENIISDLQQAESLVPESLDSDAATRGRGSLNAVRGFLAKVHLHMSDWENVANYTNQVINSGNYSLGSVTGIFGTGNSSEDVFAVQMTADTNPGVNAAMASLHTPAPIGRGDINPTEDLLNAFEEGDLRREQLIYEDGGQLWTAKYSSSNNDDNVRVIRYADILLSRAEALQEMAGSAVDAEALELVNQVRNRAGLSDLEAGTDFTTGEDLLEWILHERRIELAFEGHRKWDLLRRGEDLVNLRSTSNVPVSYGSDNAIFPIPQREIDVNENLEQNPGY